MARIAHHEGQRAPLDGLIDPPRPAVLRPRERQHVQGQRAAGQEIGSRTAKLAGTRPREGEMDSTILLVESVHLVEQRRHTLDLVDHHPVAPSQRRYQPLEGSGVAAEREKPR